MADPRLYQLNTPRYIILDITGQDWTFVGQYDDLDTALGEAEVWLTQNATVTNKLAVIETTFGVLVERDYILKQPPDSSPQ